MAKAGKKASKKRKAKKARKALPARAGKKAAAKKRTAKKGATKSKAHGEEGRQDREEGCKESRAEVTQEGCEESRPQKPAKKSAKKSANKTTKTRAVTAQETNPAVQAAPVAKRAKPTKPRAKPAAAAQPAVTAERNTYFITTPIFYPERHTAYRPCLHRHGNRRDGPLSAARRFDVRFLTGTDEHGLKMQQTAELRRPHAARSCAIATPRASAR